MGVATGFTAERMLEIEKTTVTGGFVDVNGNLLLKTREGVEFDAGHVVGPPGTTSWDGIIDKPISFPPIIGSESNQAVAGDDYRLENSRPPTAHDHSRLINDGDSLRVGSDGTGPRLYTNVELVYDRTYDQMRGDGNRPAVITSAGTLGASLSSLPFRVAAGNLSGVSVAGGTAVATTVTFPVGRFTAPPIIAPTRTNDLRDITVGASAISATSFTFWRTHAADGPNRTGVTASWIAIQMTSTNGAG